MREYKAALLNLNRSYNYPPFPHLMLSLLDGQNLGFINWKGPFIFK
jgi:hypothetical protein